MSFHIVRCLKLLVRQFAACQHSRFVSCEVLNINMNDEGLLLCCYVASYSCFLFSLSLMSTPAACIYEGGTGYWHEKLKLTAYILYYIIFTIQYHTNIIKKQKLYYIFVFSSNL